METANRLCTKMSKQSGDDATDIVQRVICIAQRVIRTDQGGGKPMRWTRPRQEA